MISSKDRSFYIGASDTSMVVGNWDTDTFAKWYGVKQGIYTQDYSNDAMKAGTAYEHRILEALHIPGLQTDKQIVTGRLRVNLDGNTDAKIYEVKTHNVLKPYKPSKAHIQQVNVEMYALGIKQACVVAYGLEDADYRNYYRDIDKERLTIHEIEYDERFIYGIYLPRFNYLCACLVAGRFPKWSLAAS